MQEEERVRQIIKWRESLSKLPDHHFFELMRMYLGEIKTPYNKQHLIERLSAFLRLPQVRENAVCLFGENDILLVAAVRALPVASLEKITLFFRDTFTPRQVREQLFNLEERLILFRCTNPDEKNIFSINPLLYDSFESLTSPAVLFFSSVKSEEQSAKTELSGEPSDNPLSPLFLAAWFSFISSEPDLCKTDGTFKKRAEGLIETVFPHLANEKGKSFIVSLVNALKNSQLVRQQEAALKPDYERWLQFAALAEADQSVYLAAASCGRFTRAALNKLAQFMLDLRASIPVGCTARVLYRCAFLLRERESGAPKTSRVAAIIQRHLASETPEGENSAYQTGEIDIRTIIEKMVLFGLLNETKDVFTAVIAAPSERSSGAVKIDAGFTVTVLPELPLVKLLPLARFLHITRFDTAAIFEISKNSCIRAFGSGLLPSAMITLLEKETECPVSQNLLFSIEDWFSGYSSVSLYKGYLLRLSEEKKRLVEDNSIFEKYLIKKIADGLYLLDFTSDEEAAEVFKKTGLPFSGVVSSMRRPQDISFFSALRQEKNCFTEKETPANSGNFSRGSVLLRSLAASLEKSDFSSDEVDSLKSRIERRIVLLPEQLRADSVRFEKVEAGGMDFLGKMQVIEYAVSFDSFIEIVYEENSDGKKIEKVLTGIPFSLEKHDGDAVVKLKIEPEDRVETLRVGKALRVRRIRGSIFKDGI